VPNNATIDLDLNGSIAAVNGTAETLKAPGIVPDNRPRLRQAQPAQVSGPGMRAWRASSGTRRRRSSCGRTVLDLREED
jgi:hypothetical protein